VRNDATDNTLVNAYGNELQRLSKKYNIPGAFGYSIAVTNRNGELRESVIVFYVDQDGETQDRMVSARILHYKEGLPQTKMDSTVNEKGVVVKRDTITVIKRDTVVITKEEILNPDSLTFQAKKVIKNSSGYIVTGNIRDKGNEIPITLSAYKREGDINLDENGVDKRFTAQGVTLYNGSKPVASVFNPSTLFPNLNMVLVKLLPRNIFTLNNWTGKQNDNCYVEVFLIPYEFWNGKRNTMSWENQVQYMRENYTR
jgi:hypothetical protein